MAVGVSPLITLISSKMQWDSARLQTIGDNIAHNDAPDYKAQDIEAFDFKAALRGTAECRTTGLTHPKHIPLNASQATGGFERQRMFPGSGEGNDVNLEEQMAEAQKTRLDHYTMTRVMKSYASLYKKAVG